MEVPTMRDRKPVTQTMSASETRQNFSDVVNRVYRGEERVLIERSGIPVAAVISARDLERFQEFERQRDADFAILDEIRAPFRGVPPEELEREAAKALTEARAELRAQREAERAHALASSR
jgi:prevent-host-death family protein